MSKIDQSLLKIQKLSGCQNQLTAQSPDHLNVERKTLKLLKPIINVIGSPITALPFAEQIKAMLEWASNRESKSVCVANVHMLMEAHWNPKFSSILKSADLVTPDGMPLVWMMKLMGASQQNRIAGMELFVSLCQLAPQRDIGVFFVGSETTILEKMRAKLKQEFPDLKIVGMEPLPFHPLLPLEDETVIQKIQDSGAGIVLVSLGCPKQEYWIHQNKGKIQAVMIGLGAVFPMLAGIHKRAPLWMQNLGLEWFYRLIQEPRRLGIRYLRTNPTFIALALRQLLTHYLGINRNTRI
ncbi:MAG: WecB/TagA/CpsF family glycosyltransferase [Potamolinea sp.]